MRILVLIALCLLALTGSVFGQPASVYWDLSSNQDPTTTVGNVVGQAQSLTNMQVSYPEGVQRSSPSGNAGEWPGDGAEVSMRYMQFAVSPQPAYSFTVNSISMKLYVNSGGSMRANVYYSKDSTFASRTQIDGTISLDNTAPSAPNVTASPNVVVNNGETFYVRIYPWYTASTTGKYVITDTVVISGTTSGGTEPTIILSTAALEDFGSVVAGNVSSSSSYSISGINLISDIVIKASEDFQIGEDSTVFADSVRLAPTAGSVPATKIFVRFSPSLATGSSSGDIEHTSNGAPARTLNVIGIAIAMQPTVQSTVTFGAVTGTSIVVNFSGGDGSHRILVARSGSAVSWSPINGSGVGSNSVFSAATDEGDGNKVVYNDTGSSVTVTGLAVGSLYFFAVYEYNIGTGNSQNYLTSSPGIGSQSTLAVAGLSASPSSLVFGNVVVDAAPVQKSFLLTGFFLTPDGGTIAVSAPDSFPVSLTSGSNFASSLQVPYAGGSCSDTIYVQFAPAAVASYSGNVTIAGGGAATISVPVGGRGISHSTAMESQPVGFASCGTGTTGGAGGTEAVVTNAQQLANIMKPREKNVTAPLIIYVSGTLQSDSDEISIKHTENISILGLGSDAKVQGFGFKIWDAKNIIVRNITFSDCTAGEGDCVSVETCSNVWIDHCSFTDSPSIDTSGNTHDGELDVKKGSYFVTLSWNHFMNHRKTCLMGHSTSETGDTVMKVTYVHNWFDGTYSRNPRVRYGMAHIVNNLYSGISDYAVGSTCQAQILLEGNYFENVPIPALISEVNDPGGTLSHDPAGYLEAVDNYLTGSGLIVRNTAGFDFHPSDFYIYSADNAQSVKDIVTAGAGAGMTEDTTDTTSTSVARTVMVPAKFELKQNYPNPFNPKTVVSYQLPVVSRVTLKIYDILGREVATMVDGTKEAGAFSAAFDGVWLASGVYIMRLSATPEDGSKSFVQVKKMIVMK
jgi:pectate lyase